MAGEGLKTPIAGLADRGGTCTRLLRDDGTRTTVGEPANDACEEWNRLHVLEQQRRVNQVEPRRQKLHLQHVSFDEA
jgi:hypothetical protein